MNINEHVVELISQLLMWAVSTWSIMFMLSFKNVTTLKNKKCEIMWKVGTYVIVRVENGYLFNVIVHV